MSEPQLRDQDYLRYDGFRVISNSVTGQIEALVPLKYHPPHRPRHRWLVALLLSWDALFHRPKG